MSVHRAASAMQRSMAYAATLRNQKNAIALHQLGTRDMTVLSKQSGEDYKKLVRSIQNSVLSLSCSCSCLCVSTVCL